MPYVGCAGILVADAFCGPLDALPREGELLALDSIPWRAGGCGANVAIDLAKQGISVDVVGRMGQDALAGIVLSALRQAEVGCEHISYSDTEPTSQTVVLLVRGQDRRYLHLFGANKEFSIAQIDYEWLSQLKLFYLGGLFVLPAVNVSALRDLLAYCRARNIITVVDVVLPADQTDFKDLYTLLPHIDFFLPNDDEARRITGCTETLDQIHALRQYTPNTIIVTQGDQGATACRESSLWRADAFQVDTIDPSGGGDAFAAGIIMGTLLNWDMPRMLQYASALGASATRAIGTTTGVLTAAEANAFLKAHSINITYQT